MNMNSYQIQNQIHQSTLIQETLKHNHQQLSPPSASYTRRHRATKERSKSKQNQNKSSDKLKTGKTSKRDTPVQNINGGIQALLDY